MLSLTMVFRIGSWALLNLWDNEGSLIWSLVQWGPILTLCVVKMKITSLNKLYSTQVVKAVYGEISGPTVWGSLGHEGSRGLNLGMAVYLQIVYTAILVWILANGGDSTIHSLWILNNADNHNRIFNFSITVLCSGWISFPLFLYQIYGQQLKKTCILNRQLHWTNEM
jgi:hypothetical protein